MRTLLIPSRATSASQVSDAPGANAARDQPYGVSGLADGSSKPPLGSWLGPDARAGVAASQNGKHANTTPSRRLLIMILLLFTACSTVSANLARGRDGCERAKRGSHLRGCPSNVTVGVVEPNGPVCGCDVRQPLISTVRFFTSGTGIAGISISSTPFLNAATASSAFTCSGIPIRR